ncbi:MAG: TlpA disulfide reductase family protein, partial [Thermoanaerobaculia bacterium]
ELRRMLMLAAIVVVAACRREQAVAPPPSGPAMLPYTAQRLDGSTFDIAKEKGNVVLLNLWATWCGPCRYEIPELEKLHAKYAQRGFKVVGVSLDEGGAADVSPFLAEQKIGYPIVLDPTGKLAIMLRTSVIPTSILVDRAGRVIWKHFGVVSTSDAELTRKLESALAR